MHISIAGRLGSGKSTIARMLGAEHGYEVYSTGAIQREIAHNRHVSTLEMNKLMAKDLSIDHAIDDAVKRISVERESETIIFDSRMAWNFAVNSFKVFVTVDPLVAATRVMGDNRGEEEVYTDLEDAKSKLIKRGKLENERFIELYGVDNFNYKNYNLIIDSTFLTPDELAKTVYAKFQDYCKSKSKSEGGTLDIVLSPASLYPLAGIKSIEAEMLNLRRDKMEYIHNHISIVVFEGYHYIVDGLHRVLAAILNGESLIHAEEVDLEKEPFFEDTQNIIAKIKEAGISAVYDLEEVGKFMYKSYPDHYDASPDMHSK